MSQSLVYTQQSSLVTFLSLAFLGIKIPSNQSQSSIVLQLVTRLCSEVSIILKQKPFIWSTTPWKPQLLKMQITFLDAECSETSIRVARSSWCRVLICPGISRVLSQMHFYFFYLIAIKPSISLGMLAVYNWTIAPWRQLPKSFSLVFFLKSEQLMQTSVWLVNLNKKCESEVYSGSRLLILVNVRIASSENFLLRGGNVRAVGKPCIV